MSSKCIVIDTNVYLSALLFGGNPRRVVERALLGSQSVVMSEEIYTEMKKVVTIKFPEFIPSYSAFEVMLRENTILVPLGSITIDACRDNKDNIILETAVIGNCDAIITGDKDLLSLGHYKEISIFTPFHVVTSGLLD